ncbi:MAG TPA: Uma2 family endonuclease [Panacibacter sp.]|nr:Uma2 family endonuclease [Panacibacter sp.]
MALLMQRPENLMDVYKLLPEGTPIQLINNRFYMSPAPVFKHFETVDAVVEALKTEVKKKGNGRVVFAPVDVYLGSKNALQPDIMFIHKNNLDIIKENGIHGTPDIIIEVLSPGNKNDDLVKKKEVYEAFGVKEYFIAEPSDKAVITYYLKNGIFEEQKKYKGKLVSKILKKTILF